MFRKIHSNKDSGATLGAELKRELGKYFVRPGFYCHYVLNKYPLTFFSVMVVSILLSCILSFTVMRIEKPGALPVFSKTATGGSSGLAEMIGAYSALNEVTTLQNRIGILARKDSLNAGDSIEVIHILKRIDYLRNTAKSQKKQSNEDRP